MLRLRNGSFLCEAFTQESEFEASIRGTSDAKDASNGYDTFNFSKSMSMNIFLAYTAFLLYSYYWHIMEQMRKFFPAVVVLLLLVVATEADVAPMQTRDCETESVRFAGLCMVEVNCANVCRTEGFSGGRCSTFARNCICIKPC
ncbi:hypothetical protein GUJ93_ZPchr0015g6973 [Zizania palustris]|uniref:Knottins-like domain-containing protein n=1 Tax=Zizania palustris TaxID=103762 RepID=A0A8J5W719_ZIZPA|nr:hypothetical protein GUJ93_ZPchr0015g6973 [Zizania palustris]